MLSIINTFEQRNTQIPVEIPVVLTEEYANRHQRQWEGFLSSFTPDDHSIADFPKVIETIRIFLAPLLLSTANKELFDLTWKAGSKMWIAENR
jgi:hypothetical protein